MIRRDFIKRFAGMACVAVMAPGKMFDFPDPEVDNFRRLVEHINNAKEWRAHLYYTGETLTKVFSNESTPILAYRGKEDATVKICETTGEINFTNH